METLIIGAGPAGLTAAYELERQGLHSTILESDRVVGGISRTVNHQGYRFDIGGHRFFSKNSLVNDIWTEMLGKDFLVRPRQSRIYYNGHFFDYPLKVANALRGLGLTETARIGMSYLRSKLAPTIPEDTFEQWVSNRFGWRLYEIFFKTYTEKVWGMPCNEISAEWASQRIKNLSLTEILRNLFNSDSRCKKGQVITSLIEQFHYPRFGPGMMWERFETHLRERNIDTIFDMRVEKIWHKDGRIQKVGARTTTGNLEIMPADQFISSMPIRELIHALDPLPPKAVLEAASNLRYRDYLTVVLMVDRDQIFPDNWIYIHSPEIKMGRIQNYKNWSPEMVPYASKTSLGLEYFVSEHEDMWSWSDDKLIDLGIQECAQLGFVKPGEIQDSTVFRMKKAYPVYDQERDNNVATIKNYLAGLKNLQAIGRNGQHHYNNMDHSMLTGFYAAQNIAGECHDVWSVNVDQSYHEGVPDQRLQPLAVKRDVTPTKEDQILSEALANALATLDPMALGLACGIVLGLGLCLMTIILLLKGGDQIGITLSLLNHFLIGYSVTWHGALVGLFEGIIVGVIFGTVFATLYNGLINGYIFLVSHIAQRQQLRDILQ